MLGTPRFVSILDVLHEHDALELSELAELTGLSRAERHVADLMLMGAVVFRDGLVAAAPGQPHDLVLSALASGPTTAEELQERLVIDDLAPVLVDLLDGGFIRLVTKKSGPNLELIEPDPMTRIMTLLEQAGGSAGSWDIERRLRIGTATLALRWLERGGRVHLRRTQTGALLAFRADHFEPDDTGWLNRRTQPGKARLAAIDGGRADDAAPRRRESAHRQLQIIDGGRA